MDSNITKHPLVLYKDRNIHKEWYQEMKQSSTQLLNIVNMLHLVMVELEKEKSRCVQRIEQKLDKKDASLLTYIKNKINECCSNCINELRDYDINIEVLKMYVQKKESLEIIYERLYTRVHNENRLVLQHEVNQEEFLKYILLNDDALLPQVKAYTTTAIHHQGEKNQQLDGRFMKILSCLTIEPNGKLHAYKLGTNSPDYQINSKKRILFNPVVAYQVFYSFLRENELALQRIPVKTVDFWRINSSIYYMTQKNNKEVKRLFEASDQFIELSLHPNVIRFLEEHQQNEWYYIQFKKYLQRDGLSDNQALALFKHLVQNKAVIQKVKLEQNRNPLGEMISFLTKHQLDPLFIETLQEIQIDMETFETGKVVEKEQAIKNIKQTICQLLPQGEKIRGPILKEIQFSSKQEEEQVAASISDDFITYLSNFILLFDMNIRVQYELATLFSMRYGDAVIPLSDKGLLHEFIYPNIHHFYPYYNNIHYHYSGAIAKEVHVLDKIRDQFIHELTMVLEKNTDEQINIKPLIIKYANRIPENYKQNQDISFTLSVQSTSNHVIINKICEGQEKHIGLLKDFFTEKGTIYENYREQNYTKKHYYEIDELFGFSGATVHKRKDRRMVNIDAGYQQFHDPKQPSIEQFYIRYDQKTKKLMLLDHQFKQAKIAYPSPVNPVFLPGVLSFVLLLFQSGRLNIHIDKVWEEQQFLPRLTFDDSVLTRKKWKLKEEWLYDLIHLNKPEREQFRLIQVFFQENNLPKQFLFTCYQLGKKEMKSPIFMDVTIPIYAQLFIEECKTCFQLNRKMYLEEVLPKPDETLREYMIEYTVDYVKKGQISQKGNFEIV